MIRELRAADPDSIGPYRLLGRLGIGGMGVVYLANSPGGRLVAIKVIRPELAEERGFRSRFASEIAVARNVSGIYTAAVVDTDPDAEMPWLATAYVAGPSLGDAVDDEGPLPVRSVLSLAGGLAEAMQAIHAAGVVHRDLKPSNVLLAADGPRVIDFGISRASERSRLTVTGVVMGSPGFLSPEQATGKEVGPPSDVFSLGAVLAFAATGDSPFGGGPTMALLYRVVNEEPDLSQVPARLRSVIEPCLAKDPASRPSPAGLLDMLSAETGLLTGEWLPKALTDTLHRYVPTIATQAPASQGLPTPAEQPVAPPRGASVPAIAPEPLSANAMPDDSPAADAAADATHDIHVSGGATGPTDPGSDIAPGEVPVVTARRLRRRWSLAAGVAAAVAVAVLAAVFVVSPGKPPGNRPATSPSLLNATVRPSATVHPTAEATAKPGKSPGTQTPSTSGSHQSSTTIARVYSDASYGFNAPNRVAADSTHVWVTNPGGSSVTELNASDGSLVQVLTNASYGFNGPVGIASDGTYVWIADRSGNSLTELNATDGSLVRVLAGASDGFSSPYALADDGTHVWVTISGNAVAELNASDGSHVQILTGAEYGFNGPAAIAVDGTHVWIANSTGDSVTELNATNDNLVRIVTGADYGFNGPRAIALDGIRVWVANSSGNSVTELNASDGSWVTTLDGVGYGFSGPWDMASDGTHVWVTNSGGNSVTELTTA